jgi:proteasome beta subunit
MTSASVGQPFSLCRIDKDGAHHLSDKEIEQVSKDVRRWQEAEQTAISDIFDRSE